MQTNGQRSIQKMYILLFCTWCLIAVKKIRFIRVLCGSSSFVLKTSFLTEMFLIHLKIQRMFYFIFSTDKYGILKKSCAFFIKTRLLRHQVTKKEGWSNYPSSPFKSYQVGKYPNPARVKNIFKFIPALSPPCIHGILFNIFLV